MLVKDLKFEEMWFNPNRRLLVTKRHYDNGREFCSMQLNCQNPPKLGMYFSVSIMRYDAEHRPIETQIVNLNLRGEIRPELNAPFPFEPEDEIRQGVYKKYIPWIQSAIELYKEVNQDIMPND